MMRAIRGVGSAFLLLSLGGCWWPMPGSGSNRQAHNAVEDQITLGTVGDLEELWVAETDSGSVGDPVTSVRGVHANDASAVYGFRTESGERLWAYGPGGSLGMEGPFVRGEEVWASSLDSSTVTGVGPAVAVDARTGTVLAELAEDKALAALSGHHAAFWGRTDLGPVAVATMDIFDLDTSTWVCCDGLLYGNGERPRWPVTLGADLFFDAGYGLTHPDIDNLGNGVRGYRVSPPRQCPGIDFGMCPVWATPLDGATATVPMLSDDRSTVYVGTDVGTLYAVDATTGAILWSSAVGSEVADTPALAGGSLFVPTASDSVVVLDAAGCGSPICVPMWTGSTSSRVTQQPAVAGGVVFVGTADGSVSAFDAAGCGAMQCGTLWSASTGSEITGAPAFSNGHLYVGTADGRLITYSLSA